MVKKLIIIVSICVIVGAGIFLYFTLTGGPGESYDFVSRLTPDGSGLAREVPAAEYKLLDTPRLLVGSDNFYVRLRWAKAGVGAADMRNFDLAAQKDVNPEGYDRVQKQLVAAAPNISFDDTFVFPEGMPAGYDPGAILKNGLNPGVGTYALHAEGITGEGINIAIIGPPLYTGHEEYAANIKLYEEIHVMPDETATSQASAAVSIAVGKNCGIAPGAGLYYIGVDPYADPVWGEMEGNIAYGAYEDAINRLFEINSGLPAGEKIRAIAICRNIEKTEDTEGLKKLFEMAKESGIMVITANPNVYIGDIYKGNFYYETEPEPVWRTDLTGDPDDFDNYENNGNRDLVGGGKYSTNDGRIFDIVFYRVHLPIASRTYANCYGGYTFYMDGVPDTEPAYLAGLYALALQVTGVEVDNFIKAMSDSAVLTEFEGWVNIRDKMLISPVAIVNPKALTEEIVDQPNWRLHPDDR